MAASREAPSSRGRFGSTEQKQAPAYRERNEMGIRSKGTEGSWEKRNDKRMNYGTKADQYNDKKYQGDTKPAKREAGTDRPPV